MHYVCIENNTVVAILNYLPSVPSTVRLQEITDTQADQLRAQTHYFDVADNTVKTVLRILCNIVVALRGGTDKKINGLLKFFEYKLLKLYCFLSGD